MEDYAWDVGISLSESSGILDKLPEIKSWKWLPMKMIHTFCLKFFKIN